MKPVAHFSSLPETIRQATTTDARQHVADYLLACLTEGRLSADSTPACVSGVLAAALVRAVRRVDRLARLANLEGDPFAAADLPAARADVSELAREADLLATTVAEVSGSALLADAQAHDSVAYFAWTIALAQAIGNWQRESVRVAVADTVARDSAPADWTPEVATDA